MLNNQKDSIVEITIKNEKLQLLHEKAIIYTRYKMLIVSDLHFGKITHFRKNGIGIPREGIRSNWENISSLLLNYELETVVFLGDLFHSTINDECLEFFEILKNFKHLTFKLIIGNHDIFDPEIYLKNKIEIMDQLALGPFLFTHEPLEEIGDFYTISGHIHPCVRMAGKGNQRLRLSCFHFGQHQALLPAFGSFTGGFTIKPLKKDRVFVCLETEIIEVFG